MMDGLLFGVRPIGFPYKRLHMLQDLSHGQQQLQPVKVVSSKAAQQKYSFT